MNEEVASWQDSLKRKYPRIWEQLTEVLQNCQYPRFAHRDTKNHHQGTINGVEYRIYWHWYSASLFVGSFHMILHGYHQVAPVLERMAYWSHMQKERV